MSFANQSFKLYDNAALTDLTPPVMQLGHQSDLSDNPQDYRKWFGSPLAGRKLQAASNPGVAQIIITPTHILPVWQAENPYTLGQSCQPDPNNGLRYVVQTPGTSGTTQPTMPTVIGSTVVDGGVLWRCEVATHEPSEIKFAFTQAGLDAATAGAGLELGTELLSTPAEAVEIWMRVTNAVQTVSSTSGQPEHGIAINQVTESAQEVEGG